MTPFSRSSSLPNYAQVRQLLTEGALHQACHHLGVALAQTPRDPQCVELLEQLFGLADDPLELAPAEDDPMAPTLGPRAYFLAKLGREVDAVRLMLWLMAAKPETPLVTWAEEWGQMPGVAAALPADTIDMFCSSVFQKYDGGPRHHPPPELENISRFLRGLREAGATSRFLGYMDALIYRWQGRLDDALKAARAAFQSAPDYLTAVGLAQAYRDRNEPNEAVRAFRHALHFEPSDVQVQLDIADIRFEQGQHRAAMLWYARILKRKRHHAWARPSYYAVRCVMEGDERWLARLRTFAASHRDNDRAQRLLTFFPPYWWYLPSPGEASIDLLRQAEAQQTETPGARLKKCGLSRLEAPSVNIVWRLWLERNQPRTPVTFSIGTIPNPDPRIPIGPAPWTLWRYKGTEAVTMVNAPDISAPAVQAVAALARTPLPLRRWWNQAEEVGKLLGVSAADALLGCLVHPPQCPDHFALWDWVPRCQLAATILLARLEPIPSDWTRSLRRQMLCSLAQGPMDWTVGHALLVLCLVATELPSARRDAAIIFRRVAAALPSSGYCCCLEPLASAWLQLPELTEADRARALELQRLAQSPEYQPARDDRPKKDS